MKRVHTLLLVLLLLGGLAAAQDVKRSKAVVSGQVRAASTDAKGNVLELEIMVGDEGTDQEPYQVRQVGSDPKKPSIPVAELKGLVGQWIVAAGTVTEDKLGWKSIDIVKYHPADYAKPQQ